jgi:uncharacterized membrane protein YbjE (DUF340 family)
MQKKKSTSHDRIHYTCWILIALNQSHKIAVTFLARFENSNNNNNNNKILQLVEDVLLVMRQTVWFVYAGILAYFTLNVKRGLDSL